MSGWKEKTLANLIKIKHGWAFKGESITEDPNNNIVLTPGNFNIKGGFKNNKFKYYTGNFPDDYILKEGDVVVTMTDLSKEGDTLGYSAKLPKNKRSFLHNQRIGLVELISNDANLDFIYWLMRTRNYQKTIVNSATGTTVRHTSPTKIQEYNFYLPSKKEQIAISHILTILDSKIDLLRRQNQTLENIAQALFKRWFVDFEFPCLPQSYRPSGQVNLCEMAQVCTYKRVGGVPGPDGDSWFVYVLLCENGSFYKGMTNDLYLRFYEHYTGQGAKHTKTHKPVKIVHWEKFETKDEARKREEELKTGYGRTWFQRQWEKSCMPSAQTSDGLPAHESKHGKAGLPAPECQLRMAGKMVESELGEIPEGWNIVKLGNLVKTNVSSISKESNIQAIQYLDTGSITEGFIEGTQDLNIADAPSRARRIVQHNDVLISTVRPNLRHYGILKQPSDNLIVSTGFCVITCDKIDPHFVYLLLTSNDMTEYLHSIAEGSTTAYPSLKPSDIESIEFKKPPANKLKSFSVYADNAWNKISYNQLQIQTLTKTRDTLLPKLMSGQVRVSTCN